MSQNKNMSLETMLDEERKDVLAILEGTPASQQRDASQGAASSPLSPKPPTRSMLDISTAPPRSASVSGSGAALTTPPRSAPFRSMLDISTSPPRSTAITKSAQTSPKEANNRAVHTNLQQRSKSDAAAKPAAFGHRAPGYEQPTPYQFGGFLANNGSGAALPKRITQAGKKFPSAMAEVMKGGDISTFGSKDKGRHHSIPGASASSTAKSRSPHNRLGPRSSSPSVNADPSKFVLKDGRVIDMNSAYRRLSDANLAKSGGSLSLLGEVGRRRRTSSGATLDPNDARLEKDYTTIDEEEALMDSSDEDPGSSEEERQRGRKKDTRNGASPESKPLGMGRAKGPRTAQSLMAAAEEEREEIVAQQPQKYRSLLEPEITVTGPVGERLKSSKVGGVHPHTSFDETASGLNTPMDSDTEADLTDIKRAQKLSVNTTKIMSTPATGRSVQTIYRGDFAKMQQEAHDNQRRVRKYLVATDLSDEAAHALEWTVGTVLRDGDTLLAIYCVDEEVGIANDTSGDDSHLKEQAAAVAASTRPSHSTPQLVPAHSPSPLAAGFQLDLDSASNSPAGRERGKAEQERYRAVKDISNRVSKLLRKTKLQVKVVIEVIHCKSPKHLITEVIDYISPTLVILGSRGRSALKGVILGSFSNYLVTKSSVPVMVARKRLRKHTKYKRPSIKLANNLMTPARSLAAAKID